MCKRLLAIPGFDPLVSQTIKNWMGDGKQFRRGKDASVALGLVPISANLRVEPSEECDASVPR